MFRGQERRTLPSSRAGREKCRAGETAGGLASCFFQLETFTNAVHCMNRLGACMTQ